MCPVPLCPTQQQLSDYVLGKLNEVDSDSVTDHLKVCEDCQSRIDSVDESADSMIQKLRRPTPDDEFMKEPQCQLAVADGRQLGRELEVDLGFLRDYQLIEKLGEGGMGTVYAALHTKLNKSVAIKLLPADRMHNADAISRFEREMKAIGKLHHTNIVEAYDAGEVDGKHYLVMELVQGLDVSTLVKRLGPLRVADACEIIRQAAIGLHHAHEHELVHRDIKPSNITVTPTGEVKILDLGLARLEEAFLPDGGELTSTGQIMGTLDYMAPEQLGDSHSVDFRADIYSLGATLYKLLTGLAPYADEQYNTPQKKLMAIATKPVALVSNYRDDVSQQVVDVLDRMVSKDPDERFVAASEVSLALKEPCAEANLAALVAEAMTKLDQTEPSDGSLGSTVDPVASSFTDTQPSHAKPEPLEKSRPKKRRRWQLLDLSSSLSIFGVRLSIRVALTTATLVLFVGGASTLFYVKRPGHAVALVDGRVDVEDTVAAGVAPHKTVVPLAPRNLADHPSVPITQNTQRIARFETYLQNARELCETWEGYQKATEELDSADKLAQNDEEKSRVTIVRHDVDNRRRAMHKEYDDQFEKDLDSFRQKCDEVDGTDTRSLATLEAKGRSLRVLNRVSIELLRQVEPLVKRLQAQRLAATASRDEMRQIEGITQSVGDLDHYVQTLQSFANRFPQTPKALSFKRLTETESSLWRGMQRWDTLIADWSHRDLRFVNAATASSLIATANEVMDKHPGFAAAEKATEVVRFLKAIAQRVDGDGEAIAAQLQAPLSNRIVVGLNAALQGDRRYYFSRTAEPKTVRQDRWMVSYFTGLDLQDTDTVFVNRLELKNERVGQQIDWQSPQALFAEFASSQLTELNDVNWENTFFQIINRLNDSQRIEPILRFQLMQRVLVVACTGSYPLQDAFRKSVDLLDRVQIEENANWVDPENVEGRKASMAAARVLLLMEAPKKAAQRAKGILARMNKPVMGARYKWIGWLHRNNERNWVCTMSDSRNGSSADLFVVEPGPDNASPRLEKIGSLVDGRPRLSQPVSRAFVEGRPVYALIDAAPNP